jgi:hypothetical protein
VNKVLNKLCKLRRLAGPGNPDENEKAAARAKLDELLAKHKVTEAQLDAHEAPALPVPPIPAGFNPFGPGVVVVVQGFPGFGGFGGFGGFSTGTSSITTGNAGFGSSVTIQWG